MYVCVYIYIYMYVCVSACLYVTYDIYHLQHEYMCILYVFYDNMFS